MVISFLDTLRNNKTKKKTEMWAIKILGKEELSWKGYFLKYQKNE